MEYIEYVSKGTCAWTRSAESSIHLKAHSLQCTLGSA